MTTKLPRLTQAIDRRGNGEHFRRCTKCWEDKPETCEYFGVDRKGKNGFRSVCKACRHAYVVSTRKKTREYNKAYHAANRETIRHQREDYYARHRERLLNYARIYRERNQEKLEKYDKDRYAARRKQRRNYEKKWRARNSEHLVSYFRSYRHARKDQESFKLTNRVRVQTRRARQKNAPGRHTKADIANQLEYQKRRCYYCRCLLSGDYHVDHVVPLSRGGSNDKENIVIACPKCNRSKGARLPHEWPQAIGSSRYFPDYPVYISQLDQPQHANSKLRQVTNQKVGKQNEFRHFALPNEPLYQGRGFRRGRAHHRHD